MKISVIPDKMSEENYRKQAQLLNRTLQGGLTLADNFSGKIVENVRMKGGEETVVPHGLGSIPKYRMILRQSAMANICDGEVDRYNWRFMASEDVTVTIMFARG